MRLCYTSVRSQFIQINSMFQASLCSFIKYFKNIKELSFKENLVNLELAMKIIRMNMISVQTIQSRSERITGNFCVTGFDETQHFKHMTYSY